ncbi:MAG: helix-turn-helix transcriptional regulator [Comamonadaceae bacterium]|nr:helix-turn-helix transcriptional regulator [Comamonadaceae bacterium]
MRTPLDSYNALLLHLYRLSYEQPIDYFQNAALELLKPVLPFDSAWWGSATVTDTGLDVHTIHLYRQPAEMLQAYEEVKHLDTAAQMVTMRPADTLAFDGHALFGGRHQKAARDYVRRFEQSHFFVGSILIPNRRFTRWLTLFRADERAYCTETERVTLAGLMPHVQQALELNRLTHLNQAAVAAGHVAGRGAAIADLRGVLYHSDAAFEQALRAEWDGWPGHALPAVVMKTFLQGATRFMGRGQVITLRVEHQLLFLQNRPRCAVDELTPREFTVAQLTARGNTHKEIAKLLHRSPATVRNQIRSVYDKLSVSNVAGLIEALRLVE